VYKAWDRKDLIWAVYSYFTWKTPIKTEAGVTEAIYDLAVLAGLPKPVDGSKILPELLPTYKTLGLFNFVAEEARKARVKARVVTADLAILEAAKQAKIKYGNRQGCLVYAVLQEDLPSVNALIATGWDLEERMGDGSYFVTPLVHAAKRGNQSLLRALLAAGADPSAQEAIGRDDDGQTALIMATRYDHKECVRLLVEAGAVDKWNKTALQYAREKGNQEIVALLEGV
jgi:ankyrin repeat protein